MASDIPRSSKMTYSGELYRLTFNLYIATGLITTLNEFRFNESIAI